MTDFHTSLNEALARTRPAGEDVEALALLISCTEIAQDEHGDGGTLMYEPARRLAAALLASDWLAAHDAQVAAAAEAAAGERIAAAIEELAREPMCRQDRWVPSGTAARIARADRGSDRG